MFVLKYSAPSLRPLAKSNLQSITRKPLARSTALFRCQSTSTVSSSSKPVAKSNELAKVIRDSIKVNATLSTSYRSAHYTYSQLGQSPHPVTCNSAYPIPFTDTIPKAMSLVKREISSPLLKLARYLESLLPFGS